MPAELFAGKIVLTTSNYFPQRAGHFPEIDSDEQTVPGYIQAHLPTSGVPSLTSTTSLDFTPSMSGGLKTPGDSMSTHLARYIHPAGHRRHRSAAAPGRPHQGPSLDSSGSQSWNWLPWNLPYPQPHTGRQVHYDWDGVHPVEQQYRQTGRRAEAVAGGMQDLKQLFSDLIRFETELWNAVDARLRAEHGLPLHKFEPMQVIASQRDCRVYDIAGALSLTTGGVSKLVDSIEASGHCKRRPNPGDRRSSIIELTPAGRKLLTRATKTFEGELELRLRSALTDGALKQFASALNGLRAGSSLAGASQAA